MPTTKRTGHDWIVIFQGDDGELIEGLLFGVNTATQAAAQAYDDMALDSAEFDLVALVRSDGSQGFIKLLEGRNRD